MRQINLIPKEVIEQAEAQTQKLSLIITGGATGAVLLACYLVVAGLSLQARAELGRLRAALPEGAQVAPEEALGQAEADLKGFYASNQALVPFLVEPDAYVNLLKAITHAVEGRVWLKRLDMDLAGGRVRMAGAAHNQEAVSDFCASLKALPFFHEVELVSLEQARGEGAGGSAEFEATGVLAMR